jgi:hypothetical protein
MKNNTVVLFVKLKDTNHRNFDLVASMKLSLMLVDLCQRHNPPKKAIVVADIEGVTHFIDFNFI